MPAASENSLAFNAWSKRRFSKTSWSATLRSCLSSLIHHHSRDGASKANKSILLSKISARRPKIFLNGVRRLSNFQVRFRQTEKNDIIRGVDGLFEKERFTCTLLALLRK